jgi:nicotinamidase-related amidase
MDVSTMSHALLVMDFQADIIGRLADSAPLLERTAKLIANARAAGAPVIYVVVGFRPGYPEVDARNMAFAGLAQTGRLQTTTPGSDIVPAVAPQPGDVIVMKHRVGPFLGTDLEQVLRARRVDTLVLAGISTSGVVLSTVRYAADCDYALVVAEDCCADPDPEVHQLLTRKVFPRQAKVVASSEVAFG